MKSPNAHTWSAPWLLALLVLLSVFPLFILLDHQPLFVYDESRLAKNAQEMRQTGDLIVTYFEGKPDMWNTKPPLMIWLQALSLGVFGENELGVRFPAALAGLATILALFFFGKQTFRHPTTGFLAGLVLLCTPGFVHWHVTRTGDYDSLLVLFSTLFLLSVFRYVLSSEPGAKRRAIWAAMIFFILGILTKGVVICIFLPAVAGFLLLEKQFFPLFRMPSFYYGLLLALVVVGGYYLGREALNPGYLQAVYENELGGRYLTVVENHAESPGYYLEILFSEKFRPWLLWLPLAFFFAFWGKDLMQRKLFVFLSIQVAFFLLVLTMGQTKLGWYAAPVYPLLALLVGRGFAALLSSLRTENAFFLPLLIVAGLFVYPYLFAVQKSMSTRDTDYGWERRQYSSFLRKLKTESDFFIAIGGYNAQVSFLLDAPAQEARRIGRKYPTDLLPGEKAVVCESKEWEKIDRTFEYEVLETYRSCQFIRILGKKDGSGF